ncbi:hypothetical protein [Solidesulfovibrio sp.]
MGFLSRKCPISRFRLPEQLSREQLQQAVESLARKGFRPIDTLPDISAFGWVNFDDPTDSEWRTSAPERLAHFVFTLRQDLRKVPPKLLEVRTRAEIKKFLERRRVELQEKVLIPFVNKDEKAEIRARVHLSLLSQAAPVPTMTDVVWTNPADNKQAEIWLCSTTEGVRDQFSRLFADTFNCLQPRPVTPWSPRPDFDTPWPDEPGCLFLTWLNTHDGHSLDVMGTDVAVNFESLTIADSAGACVIKAVGESDPYEVESGLDNGMLVREADILLGIAGDAYLIRVRGDDFAMRILPKFWNMDREDPDGSFADKVLSVERLFRTWDSLYRLWLREKGHPIDEAGPDVVLRKTPSGDLARTGLALAAAGVQSVTKAPEGGVVLAFKNGSKATITTNFQKGRGA